MKDRNQGIASGGKGLHGAEIYLLAALLIFGIGVIFLLPVSAGYDEETHLLRVWEMSSYTFLPNDKLGAELPFPAVYWEMSYRRPFIVRAVEADFWKKYGSLSLDAKGYVYSGVQTRSVYSPPLLFPQALVMRFLGRSQEWSALIVFYACRLAGLLSYILLTWLAVRLIPFGKWILAIAVTTPLAILQAATISADTISNGLAILFIGGSLAIAQRKELLWKDWAFLLFLFFILFWGKINIVSLALLPFLLLRPSQFKMRYGYVTLAATAVGLLLLEVLGWNLLAYSRLYTAVERADPSGQIKFILAHPLHFLAVLANNIWMNGVDYLRSWAAIYGYDYWPVPTLTFYLYGGGLLTALLIKENGDGINKKTRFGLGITFVIAYLATIASLYVTFTPVGSDLIDGVQGRYFMPVMPLLFLTLARLPLLKRIHLSAFLPAILGGASLVVYTAGMYLSYHVTCGAQFYTAGPCYQPNYKNWAPDELYSPPVSNDLTITQEIVAECDGMTRLRVWVNSAEADQDGITEFILRDLERDRDVIAVSVPNSELPVGNWFSLDFPPDWESNGRLYLLTIRSENNAGPRIAYSLRPEYPAGKLYENGQPQGKDLIFQTGCIAGLEKIRQKGSP